MRIGINTLYLIPNEVGGSETYLRGLLKGLSIIDKKNEYVLFTSAENHNSFECYNNNWSKVLCNFPVRLKPIRALWEQIMFPFYIKKYKIDVLHSPGYVSPFYMKCANVVSILDLQYKYYPENIPKVKLLYWKLFIPLSSKRSDIILTLSGNSKKDIVELLHIPEKKVIYAHLASKFDYENKKIEPDNSIIEKNKIKKNYILSVASLLPHKNLNRLIEAYSLLKDKIDHQLVLVGLKGYALNKIEEAIEKSKINREMVILTGYVLDNELISLYQNAKLFVSPSLFEGFGIPLIEAMSFGCPVAASNKTCIPEIVGNAALLFNPEDPHAIADAIYSVLSNEKLRENLIKKGYERIKLFTWEKAAQETLDAYYIALKEHN